MFNRFLKVSTTNGEQRWINLDRVTRVSLATDPAGEQVMAFCFDGQDRVLIHGADEDSRILMRRIISSLDDVAQSAGMRYAA